MDDTLVESSPIWEVRVCQGSAVVSFGSSPGLGCVSYYMVFSGDRWIAFPTPFLPVSHPPFPTSFPLFSNILCRIIYPPPQTFRCMLSA